MERLVETLSARRQGSVNPWGKALRAVQYVAHIEGDGKKMFAAVCKHGPEGIVSKKLDSPYRSGRTKSWIKVKNPKSSAATRAIDGTF